MGLALIPPPNLRRQRPLSGPGTRCCGRGGGCPPLWHPPLAARAAAVTSRRRPRVATRPGLDGAVVCSSTARKSPAHATARPRLLQPRPSAAHRCCGGVCRSVAASTVEELRPGVARPATVNWRTGGRARPNGLPRPLAAAPPAHCFLRRWHSRGARGSHRPSSSWHRWPTRSGTPTRTTALSEEQDGLHRRCRTVVCRHPVLPHPSHLPAVAHALAAIRPHSPVLDAVERPPRGGGESVVRGCLAVGWC